MFFALSFIVITIYFLTAICRRYHTQLKVEMESSPQTLTDIAQECNQDVQRIASEDTEIAQVHTIFVVCFVK